MRTAQVSGDITYNGVPMKDFVVERTCAYIDQVRDFCRLPAGRLILISCVRQGNKLVAEHGRQTASRGAGGETGGPA